MDISSLDGCDIYGFVKLSWNLAQASIQGIRRRKHWGNALLQCAAWGALCDSWLVGRSHNRKIHLQMLKYTGRDLVDAWWYLKHGWIRLSLVWICLSFIDSNYIHNKEIITLHVLCIIITHESMFRMNTFPMSLKCPFSSDNMWALRTLVWEHIWEMLGLNVPLDIAPVPHGLVADPTIVRSILRCQNVLV